MGDNPFILENFLEITAEDEGFRADIHNVYSQIGSTPEGQAMIEGAWELNNRQRISVHGIEDGDSEAFPNEGRIILSKQQISNTQYYDINDGKQNTSLNRVAFHEMYHLSDVEHREFKKSGEEVRMAVATEIVNAIIIDIVSSHLGETVDHSQARKVMGNDIYGGNGELFKEFKKRFDNSKPHEVRTIGATNAFMSKYYDAIPRDGHVTPNPIDNIATPEMEIYNNILKP